MKLFGILASTTMAAALVSAAHAQSADKQDTRFAKAPGSAEHGRQSGFFAGVGAGSFAFNTPTRDTIGTGGIALRGGYNVNKYLSVSAETLIPTNTYPENENRFYTSSTGRLTNAFGIFLEPRLPIGDVVGLYGRIGYFNGKIEDVPQRYGINTMFVADADISALGYGGGVDFDIGRHVTLAFDITVYDTDFDTAGAGLLVKGRF